MRRRITFHSIAPEIYSRLRERWGISTKDYLVRRYFLNVLINNLHLIIQRSLKHPMAAIGPLKSGAYFFYTQDNRFIIKFIPALHAKVCWQKLPAYFKVYI
jgi:hypothetical protein